MRSKPPPRASGRPRVPPSLNRNTTSRRGVGDEKVMRSIERRAQLRQTRPRSARQRPRAGSALDEKRVPSGSSLETTLVASYVLLASRCSERRQHDTLDASRTENSSRVSIRLHPRAEPLRRAPLSTESRTQKRHHAQSARREAGGSGITVHAPRITRLIAAACARDSSLAGAAVRPNSAGEIT